jgi:putative hemolysin
VVSKDAHIGFCEKGLSAAIEDSAHLFKFDSQDRHYVFPKLRPVAFNKILSAIFMRISGLSPLNSVTSRFMDDQSNDPFFVRLARAFELKISENAGLRQSLAHIPLQGPVIFVLNHPLSGSEGIAVAAEIAKIRPDLKIMLTQYLEGFPELKDSAFFVNPYKTKPAAKYNQKIVKELVVPHLENGGSMLIFPSGDVSEMDHWTGELVEAPWERGLARIVNQVANAKIVPIYVSEKASESFYNFRRWSRKELVGKIFKAIQPIMHVREIANNRGRTLLVQVGYPIEGSSLIRSFTQPFSNENKIGRVDYESMMAHLRALTLALKDREALGTPDSPTEERPMAPIWAPMDEPGHRVEVGRELSEGDPLPLSAQGASGARVYLIDGERLRIKSSLAMELGRLRERVFRAVGEGTGKDLDFDNHFDLLFWHLVAFDSKAKRIIGAYRMGRLDELAKRGLTGYTNVQFSFSDELSDRLGLSGLEFGRSISDKTDGNERKASFGFFRIWQRIGGFIADNPHYRYLIGPVSISNAYSGPAKRIIVAYLKRTYKVKDPSLTAWARPGYEYKDELSESEREIAKSLHSIDDLERVVRALDGKDLPPLLKIYETLGAKYLAFSFDPDFNSVDGMIIIDLHDMITDLDLRKRNAKYLGQEGLQRYLERCGI